MVSEDTEEKSEGSLSIYGLKPLSVEDIRQFALHHYAPDIDRLITEIQRANLLEMASRPFDLEGLLSKWKADGRLGSRLESLQHIVDVRLNEIDPSRKQRQPLNQAKAREGARRLAAAVTLSSEAGILVPDITHEKAGLDAEQVLADWNPNDVRALLERGIFNDILYGTVRFRHRDIRELLTAEWLYSLLKKSNSRRQIESLLFREQYGEEVITPRLRPILPWLILFDELIRERALALNPEIAVESGDAARLPLLTRKTILSNIVSQIVADKGDHSVCDTNAIVRIAQQDLTDDVRDLIIKYSDNDDAIFFLGRLAWQGSMGNCLYPLLSIAIDPSRSIYPRIASVRAVSTVGTHEQLKSLWETINQQSDTIPRRLLVELVEEAAADDQIIGLLLSSIEKLAAYEKYETSGLDRSLHLFLDRFVALTAQEREPLLAKLCVGLNNFLGLEPHHERRDCRVSSEFTWLMGPATHAVEMLIADRAKACFDNEIIGILLKIPAMRHWRGDQLNEYKDKLQELIPPWVEFNDVLFWKSVDHARTWLTEKNKRLIDDCSLQCLGHYWRFEDDSFFRVVAFVQAQNFEDDKLVALSLAFRVFAQAEQPADWRIVLNDTVSGNQILEDSFNQLLNPPVSEKREKREQVRLESEQQREKKRLERERGRKKWVERLRANPDVVRNPPELPPGEWTNDQCWLLREMDGEGLRTDSGRSLDWRSLVDEFGEDVALAFRDAAMKHWRSFKTELRSEGADTSSIQYSL
ncbi:MAG: NACHT domain-containing protein, partial [Pseudomonadales bacterium]